MYSDIPHWHCLNQNCQFQCLATRLRYNQQVLEIHLWCPTCRAKYIRHFDMAAGKYVEENTGPWRTRRPQSLTADAAFRTPVWGLNK